MARASQLLFPFQRLILYQLHIYLFNPPCSGILFIGINSNIGLHPFLSHTATYIQSHMSKEYEMDMTAAGKAAAGTTAAPLPTGQRSDENQRPSISRRFLPSIKTGGSSNHEKLSLQDALAQISPSEVDAHSVMSTGTVEDFDALLAALDSEDEEEPSIEDEIPTVGEARAVPSVLLETSPTHGLDDAEILSRRKRYGWNMMKEENRSHLKTFLMFFVGPIQCVMLVSQDPSSSCRFPVETNRFSADMTCVVSVCPGCGPTRLDRSGSYRRPPVAQCGCWLHSRLSSWKYCQGTQKDAGTEMYSLAQRWDSSRGGCNRPCSRGHRPPR